MSHQPSKDIRDLTTGQIVDEVATVTLEQWQTLEADVLRKKLRALIAKWRTEAEAWEKDANTAHEARHFQFEQDHRKTSQELRIKADALEAILR